MLGVTTIQLAAYTLLLASWLLAAFSDLRTMTIPNAISVMMILGFFVLAPISGLPLTTIAFSVLAAVGVFALCFALFAINAMGGGDAKLLTASSLWFGLNFHLVEFILLTAVYGGILTLALVLLRSKAMQFQLLYAYLPRSLTVSNKIPYGIAIAIGGMANLDNIIILQL